MSNKPKTLTYREAFAKFATPHDMRGGLCKCHLCGKKATHMRGIAMMSHIKLKDAKTEHPVVIEYEGPKHFMYLCPRCHYRVWSMFFELWDAVTHGEIRPLFDGDFHTVIKLAKEHYKKSIRNNPKKGTQE